MTGSDELLNLDFTPGVALAPVDLLERAGQLEAVVDRFRQLDQRGHLVLISGEAGVGKSALVAELMTKHLVGADVLIGRCDDLFAPRPLGPLADIARARPGPLADALADGDAAVVFDTFLGELSSTGGEPVVLVLEDLQWADEATLDLLRFVTRRLDRIGCLILATHRDDLRPEHPLRRTFGSLVGPLVTRLHLPPLSPTAVRTLVGDRNVDADSLHASTGGNPFFLVESLAHTPGALPASVRDLILARTANLSGAARDALDAAAVLGHRTASALIEVVGDCDGAAIDECIRAGLLVDERGVQVFRHDLTRQVIEEALTPLRRRQLHGRALHSLDGDVDVVRRAHHAVGAADTDAVVELAWRAADECVSFGAWRQAADLYREAVFHSERLADADRLRLLKSHATTALRVEQVDDAIASGETAHALLSEAGDDAALGEWEIWMSGALRAAARDGWAMLESAVMRLEPLGESAPLADGLSNLTGQLLVTGRYGECVAAARRAIDIGEHLDLEQVVVYSLNSLGAALGCMPDGDFEAGVEALGASIDRAKRAGLHSDVTRGAANLAFLHLCDGQPALAMPVYEAGIQTAQENELRYQLNCLLPGRAEALMMLGDWDTAEADLKAVLDDPDAAPINRAVVLGLLGRLAARRGDPSAQATLDEAMALATRIGEAQLICPILTTRSELAWFEGNSSEAADQAEAAIELATNLDRPALRDLTRVARRAGLGWSPDIVDDEPTRLFLAGEHVSLAGFWDARGSVYEAADALADADVGSVRLAHERLIALGAHPRALMAARRLRDLGEREIPRGPRASTRSNAAGLTARELEVAALVVEGLTNTEIADVLIVSRKTVDHHVSAILSKLGVASRRQVADAVAARGIVISPG